MADCPTGVLVEFEEERKCVDRNKRSDFEDFISSLGASYMYKTPNLKVSHEIDAVPQPIMKSPSSCEDDLITNETFDFHLPSSCEIDSPQIMTEPACIQESKEKPVEPFFQFPVLPMNFSPPKSTWTTEVEQEAKKMSKRLSLRRPLLISNACISDHCEFSPITSQVDDTGSMTCSLSSSCKPEDKNSTSNSVKYFAEKTSFCSPINKDIKKQNIRDKENISNLANQSPTFVPHPNPEEALTPVGVKKIRGPLTRRGTFTLDNNQTPKSQFGSSIRMTTPNRPLRNSAILKPMTPGNVLPLGNISKTIVKSTINNRLENSPANMQQNNTPKTIPKVLSFSSTPQAKAKISTFRKNSTPKLSTSNMYSKLNSSLPSPSVPGPRKISAQLSNIKEATGNSLTKAGGPPPLLRKAFMPSLTTRGSSSGSKAIPTKKGPLKATTSHLTQPTQHTTSISSVHSRYSSAGPVHDKTSTLQLNSSQQIKSRNSSDVKYCPSKISTPLRLVTKKL